MADDWQTISELASYFGVSYKRMFDRITRSKVEIRVKVIDGRKHFPLREVRQLVIFLNRRSKS